MTAKLQTVLYSALSGLTGYVAYFLALPPNLQTGIMGDLISIAPASWQPALAGSAKSASTLLGIYAMYKAAHSNPPTGANPEQPESKP